MLKNLAQAKASAKKDLEDAIIRLNELRQKIEKEKIPLSSEVYELERKALEKRAEVDRRNQIRDNRDANLIQLKEEVKNGNAELDSIKRTLADYTRSWSESTPPGEESIARRMVENSVAIKTGNRKDEISSLLEIASVSTDFIQMQAGGMNFRRCNRSTEGTREQGIFWSVGPVLYFSGKQGSSGLVRKTLPRADPLNPRVSLGIAFSNEPARLVPTIAETANLIGQTLGNENQEIGLLPLDPTLGKATVLEVGEPTILEELQKGGIWIYPILFFALLSTIIAIYKAVQILSIPSPRSPVTLAGNFSGPFERLRKTAQGYRGKKPEILEEILYEIIIDFQERLEKGLPLVAITAAIAPFLVSWER